MRLQLALNVADLDEAIDFYTRMFGTEPAKIEPGYANFAIDEPPLKLVLFAEGGEPGSINHLGVETDDRRRGHRCGGPNRRQRHRDHRRRRHRVLLCREDRDLGARPGRTALGVVRQDRRCRPVRVLVARRRRRRMWRRQHLLSLSHRR